MKVIHIEREKFVQKTEEEITKEQLEYPKCYVAHDKRVPLKEPIYIVEMTMEELQLVSFYLELEKRKPIVNVQVDAKLTEAIK